MAFVTTEQSTDQSLENIVGLGQDNQEKEPASRTQGTRSRGRKRHQKRCMRYPVAEKHDSPEQASG